jgi:hypothetical protein
MRIIVKDPQTLEKEELIVEGLTAQEEEQSWIKIIDMFGKHMRSPAIYMMHRTGQFHKSKDRKGKNKILTNPLYQRVFKYLLLLEPDKTFTASKIIKECKIYANENTGYSATWYISINQKILTKNKKAPLIEKIQNKRGPNTEYRVNRLRISKFLWKLYNSNYPDFKIPFKKFEELIENGEIFEECKTIEEVFNKIMIAKNNNWRKKK